MSAWTNQFIAGPAKPREPIANNVIMNGAGTLMYLQYGPQ